MRKSQLRVFACLRALLAIVLTLGTACIGGRVADDEGVAKWEESATVWPPSARIWVVSSTASSITVAWTPAPGVNPPYTNYRLYMDGTDAAHIIETNLAVVQPDGTYQYVVTGLASCTSHTFSVEPGQSATSWTGYLLSGAGSTTGTASPTKPGPLPPGPTEFFRDTKWIYTGTTAYQTGVVAGTLTDPTKVSVVQGQVTDAAGSPLACVSVQVQTDDGAGNISTATYGASTTDGNGRYYLALNASSRAVLNFTRNGYHFAQRTLQALPRRYTPAPTVAMVVDDPSTYVAVNTAGTPASRTVTGATESETFTTKTYSRTAKLAFPPGMTASWGGAPQSSFHVAVKEYTVGPNGMNAMPGEVGAGTDYTYAVAVNIKEANGQPVTLSAPVAFYVDNFIGAPLGTATNPTVVPLGSYDPKTAAWVPEPDGYVIQVTGKTTDSPPRAIVAGYPFTLTDDELQQLAALYPGSTGGGAAYPVSLLRVELKHFTDFDLNFSTSISSTAKPPSATGGPLGDVTDPDCASGSIIECQNRALGETIPLAGTPFGLHYRSNRQSGVTRLVRIAFQTPVGDPSFVTYKVEGWVGSTKLTIVDDSPTMLPNSHVVTLSWDGTLAGGAYYAHGAERYTIRVGFTYQGEYGPPGVGPTTLRCTTGLPAFCQSVSFGTGPSGAKSFFVTQERGGKTIWQTLTGVLEGFDDGAEGFGGWSLTPHHVFQPDSGSLYFGNGGRYRSPLLERRIVQATPSYPFTCCGPDAAALAVGPDGAVYHITPGYGSISPTGTIYRMPWGSGAVDAPLGGAIGGGAAGGPLSGSLAIDADSYVYLPWSDGSVVRTKDGITVEQVLGNADSNFAVYRGNGGSPGTPAPFQPRGLAFGPDGTLYIADDAMGVIWSLPRPTVGGKLRAGRQAQLFVGQLNSSTDSTKACTALSDDSFAGAATALCLPNGSHSMFPRLVAFATDGTAYAAMDNRIWRIDRSGLATRYAGTLSAGPTGTLEGVAATSAWIPYLMGLTVDPGGVLFYSEVDSRATPTSSRVRAVVSGAVNTVTGTQPAIVPARNHPTNGAISTESSTFYVGRLATSADGSVLFGDGDGSSHGPLTVYVIQSPYKFVNGLAQIPSPDATEIYGFDETAGQHKSTIDALTGFTRYTFDYDATSGLLTAIHDKRIDTSSGASDATTIARSGSLVTIQSPTGQTTTLTLSSPTGKLRSVQGPLSSEQYAMTYWPSGLLGTFQDPKGVAVGGAASMHGFNYDSSGFLAFDQKPSSVGGSTTLTQSNSFYNGLEVTLQTAVGRKTIHTLTTGPDGTQTRTTINPFGVGFQHLIGADGSESTLGPDNAVTSTHLSADPRFGSIARYVDTSTYQPSPTRPTVSSWELRCATNSSGALTELDTLDTLSASSSTSTYATQLATQYLPAASPSPKVQWRKFVLPPVSTPSGLTAAIAAAPAACCTSTGAGCASAPASTVDLGYAYLDAKGRLTTRHVPGLADTYYYYDSYGRSVAVQQGDDCATYPYPTIIPASAACRRATLSYATSGASAGYLASVTDSAGRTVSYAPDALGRPVTVTLPTSGAARTVGLGYDPNGNVTTVSTPQWGASRPHKFTFDLENQLTNYNPPPYDGSTSTSDTYGYDLDGLFTSDTRPSGGPISNTLDEDSSGGNILSGRLRRMDFDEGAMLYDAWPTGQPKRATRLSKMPDEFGRDGQFVDVTYDGALPVQLSAVWRNAPSNVLSTSIGLGYDDRARLLNLTLSAGTYTGNRTATYSPLDDGIGSITWSGSGAALSPGLGTITLSRVDASGAPRADGRLTGANIGGTSDGYQYNTFGELGAGTSKPGTFGTGYTVLQPGGASLASLGYARDQLGRITQVVETLEQGPAGAVGTPTATTRNFSYYTEGWLKSETNSSTGTTTSWTYDLNGNRLTEQVGAATSSSYSYDYQDRLKTIVNGANSDTFSFDPNGRLSKRVSVVVSGGTPTTNTTLYTYDSLGNLAKVTLPGGATVTYITDAAHRRIGRQSTAGVWTHYIYGAGLLPIAETDANGNVTREFIFGTRANVPDLVIANGLVYRVVADHLGSVRRVYALAGSAWKTVERRDYDAWGRINPTTYYVDSTWTPLPFGFAGGLWDVDTGLVRFGARDYDPSVGRWTAKDPLGVSAGAVSLYRYANNDPLDVADPSGLVGIALGGNFAFNLGIYDGFSLGAGVYFADEGGFYLTLSSPITATPYVGPSGTFSYFNSVDNFAGDAKAIGVSIPLGGAEIDLTPDGKIYGGTFSVGPPSLEIHSNESTTYTAPLFYRREVSIWKLLRVPRPPTIRRVYELSPIPITADGPDAIDPIICPAR